MSTLRRVLALSAAVATTGATPGAGAATTAPSTSSTTTPTGQQSAPRGSPPSSARGSVSRYSWSSAADASGGVPQVRRAAPAPLGLASAASAASGNSGTITREKRPRTASDGAGPGSGARTPRKSQLQSPRPRSGSKSSKGGPRTPRSGGGAGGGSGSGGSGVKQEDKKKPTRVRNQNDYICTVCEGTTGLHPCEGGCLRSFHAACVGLSGPPQKPWRCDNCTAERQPCFACGKFGRSAKARTADAANVRKCSVPACGKFYHLECVSKLPMTRLNKERFTCPMHCCAKCRESGKNQQSARCTRCATAYHYRCLPRANVRLLMERRFVCKKHYNSEEWAKLTRAGLVGPHATPKPGSSKRRRGASGDNQGDGGTATKKQRRPSTLSSATSGGSAGSRATPHSSGGAGGARTPAALAGLRLDLDASGLMVTGKRQRSEPQRMTVADMNTGLVPMASPSGTSTSEPSFASARAAIEGEAGPAARGKKSSKPGSAQDQGSGQPGTPRPDGNAEEEDDAEEESDDSEEDVQVVKEKWVQCDRCKKWRELPGFVDTNALPEQWYCETNKWDARTATCSAPEMPYNDSPSGKGGKSQRSSSSSSSKKRKSEGKKKAKSSSSSKRRSSGASGSASAAGSVASAAAGGGGAPGAAAGDGVDAAAMAARRRGRKARAAAAVRINYKESVLATSPAPPAGSMPSASPKASGEYKLRAGESWIRCNSCTKIRVIPAGVDGSTLPARWSCADNTWNAAVASCTAPALLSAPPGSRNGGSLGDPSGGGAGGGRSSSAPGTLGRSLGGGGGGGGSTTKSQVQWVQCDSCLKWRQIPSHVDMDSLPAKWFCRMNEWDRRSASCDAPALDEHRGPVQMPWMKGNANKLSFRDLIFGAWNGRLRSTAFTTNRTAARESDIRFGESSLYYPASDHNYSSSKSRARRRRQKSARAQAERDAVSSGIEKRLQRSSLSFSKPQQVWRADAAEAEQRAALLALLPLDRPVTVTEAARRFSFSLAARNDAALLGGHATSSSKAPSGDGSRAGRDWHSAAAVFNAPFATQHLTQVRLRALHRLGAVTVLPPEAPHMPVRYQRVSGLGTAQPRARSASADEDTTMVDAESQSEAAAGAGDGDGAGDGAGDGSGDGTPQGDDSHSTHDAEVEPRVPRLPLKAFKPWKRLPMMVR